MTARPMADGQVGRRRAVVTRFAPSPTGRLHLGHAFSAVRAHDLARADGGRFLIRVEDIDGTRSRSEFIDSTLADLAWLGLDWDDLSFQSERLAGYADALAELQARGLAYPCFCTRADIMRSVTAPHGPEAAYPGTCRALSPERRHALIGHPHCWRLDMRAAVAETGALLWHDATAGDVTADPLRQGDIVIARKDAPASYHLAVTMDDAAQGITHVVRGADLFAATDVHRLLQALLGLPTPDYAHHPLVVGADGARLAKRHGSPTLESMRLAGVDGIALAEELRESRLPTGFALASPPIAPPIATRADGA